MIFKFLKLTSSQDGLEMDWEVFDYNDADDKKFMDFLLMGVKLEELNEIELAEFEEELLDYLRGGSQEYNCKIIFVKEEDAMELKFFLNR